MSLKSQALSGVRWTTISSLVRAGVQFLQVLILARLLLPHDFGMVAVVMALMSFLQIFADMGISNAIIYQRVITQVQLSTLYWLNVGASLALCLVVALGSPFVASFYHQPALRPLILVASLTLFVGALGQQVRVVAEKNLRFAQLAKIEIAGAVMGLVSSVLVACAGGGVYALLTGSLCSAAAVTALLWVFLSDGWRPSFVFERSCIGEFLRFGVFMISNNLMNSFNSQVDVLLGGRLLGAQAIGLFSLPRDLSLRVSLVINPIMTRVGLPVLAQSQGDRAVLKKVYLSTVRMTASVNFPIYAAMFFFAPEVVHLFFGPRWGEAAAVMRVLAAWGLVRSLVNNPIGMLCMGIGRPDLNLKWNAAMLAVFPPALWIGGHYGVMGLALGLCLPTALVAVFPVWYFIVRPVCGIALPEYLAQICVPLGIALAAGMGAYLAAAPVQGVLARVCIGGAVGGALYVALSRHLNKVWFTLMTELLLSWKPSATPAAPALTEKVSP